MNWHKIFGVILILATIAAMPGPALAEAPTPLVFTVNSTQDIPDLLPGNKECETSAGTCTLRAAIQETNFWPSADRINLPAGNYPITRIGDDNSAENGDLDIVNDLTIKGAGANLTTIYGNGDVTGDRAIHIYNVDAPNSVPTIRLIDMTVRGGKSSGRGGGIYNYNGELTLERVWLVENKVVQLCEIGCETGGSAIWNEGKLTILDSIITNNRSYFSDGISLATFPAIRSNTGSMTISASDITNNLGGGIYSQLTNVTIADTYIASNTIGGGLQIQSGAVSIFTSDIYANQNNSDGGGVNISGGNVTIANTDIRSNQSSLRGGGIIVLNASSVNLLNTLLYQNKATQQGGGAAVISPGYLKLLDSTLQLNSTSFDGGGIYSTGTVLLERSVLFDNSATGVAGGIDNFGGSLILNNSTISRNTATGIAGGILNEKSGSASLNNATIAFNTTGAANGGGGINVISGVVDFRNTILSNNTQVGGGGGNNDCTGTLNSLRYNLIQTVTGCTILNDDATNLKGIDPSLGPLAYNGGKTPTHALLAGSPVIDKGNPDGCLNHLNDEFKDDQRGFFRPFDGDDAGEAVCDIGAFEKSYAVFLPLLIK